MQCLYLAKKIINTQLMLSKLNHYIAAILTSSSATTKNIAFWQYAFGVLLLLLCGFKLFSGIQNHMDIQLADEAAYLRFGLDLFEKMNRNWGPMYAVWYKCLSFYSTNPIELYYINYSILSILVGIVVYLFLLRLNVKPIFALYLSFCLLVSNLNIEVWPRVSHFCLIIITIAFIFATFLNNNIYKCLVITLACLICTYARPEFYVAFLLMLVITILTIYYNRKSIKKKDVYLFFVFLLCIIILHLIFRFPSNDFFGYNRGVAAFYQHYAWNYKMRTLDTSFDAWLNWEDLAKNTFSDCNSMWCVIKTHTKIFISNTLFNVRTYIVQLIKTITYVFPVGLFYGNKKHKILLLGVFILFILLLIKKDSRKYFTQKIIAYKFYLLMIFCFIFPTFLSCIIIFPRDHYLFLQLLFWLLIFVSLFGYLFEYVSDKPLVFIVFGLLLYLATPKIINYSFLKATTDNHTLCVKKLVRHLEKDFDRKQHTIFTNLPFVHGMLPSNFNEMNTIFDKKKNIPFKHYLDSAQYDIIIVVPSLLRDPHIKNDSTWTHFFNHYEEYNFKRDNFTDCEMYLLVKNTSEKQQ